MNNSYQTPRFVKDRSSIPYIPRARANRTCGRPRRIPPTATPPPAIYRARRPPRPRSGALPANALLSPHSRHRNRMVSPPYDRIRPPASRGGRGGIGPAGAAGACKEQTHGKASGNRQTGETPAAPGARRGTREKAETGPANRQKSVYRLGDDLIEDRARPQGAGPMGARRAGSTGTRTASASLN